MVQNIKCEFKMVSKIPWRLVTMFKKSPKLFSFHATRNLMEGGVKYKPPAWLHILVESILAVKEATEWIPQSHHAFEKCKS